MFWNILWQVFRLYIGVRFTQCVRTYNGCEFSSLLKKYSLTMLWCSLAGINADGESKPNILNGDINGKDWNRYSMLGAFNIANLKDTMNCTMFGIYLYRLVGTIVRMLIDCK